MFARSIRSKFLLWLAFLLICLLIGFGVTAYELFRTNQNHQIYEQFQRRLSAVAGDVSTSARGRPMGRPGGPGRDGSFETPAPDSSSCETTNHLTETNASLSLNEAAESNHPSSRKHRRIPHDHFDDFSPPPKPGESPDAFSWKDMAAPEFDDQRRPPDERGEPNAPDTRPEPPALKLSAEVLDLFDQSNPNSFYFAVWSRLGTERLRSSNAPAELEIAAPVQRAGGPQIRTRGEFVESYLHHVVGYRILVGRSIAPELAARRHFALWLVAAAP